MTAAVTPVLTEGIAINPYGFENMVCETWLIEPGTNPYYPKGVCADTPTNLSAVVPDTCLTTGLTGGAIDCPTVDFSTGSTFGIGDTNPILQGYESRAKATPRGCSPGISARPDMGQQTVGDFTAVTCGEDDTDAEATCRISPGTTRWISPRATGASSTATS